VHPAFFGCLLAPFTFSIACKLGASAWPAFLAGCFVVFDLMNTIESRHILVDSQLMFYSALSLWLALKYWERCNNVCASLTASCPIPLAWPCLNVCAVCCV
jgi:dolichyl-phosphate-mannose--protein O-mannosyl transferase